ncbi:S41 family peptidase [Sphingobacterium corticibacter]|uniref:Tail specific protease domain-containing protein n=1 Tax=Sphingobacterium corticibacter TaxID=2171749 RepID=A0A2T8HGP4_9SPHI|nr:S41 family peptidase [Sphingobacterium corticibacter]PVH24595.1 hypothetical protein DC487_13755 [Sphingobacterium corticibacter]
MKNYIVNIRSIVLIVPALFVMLNACRKDMPELERPTDYPGGNFEEVFETFWNGMNNNYVFWDIDTTDWDQVYRRYQPIFATMNINDTADVRRSYTYFKTMTNGLVDSHYALQFRSEILSDSATINPAFQRKQRMEDFRGRINPNHFFNTIPPRYLNPDVSRVIVNEPNAQYFAVSGTAAASEGIAYLYFNSFNLSNLYETSETYAATLDHFFANVLEGEQPRGVIIDVRNNGGGALADLDFLLGRMITSPLHFGYTKSKLTNNRLDFTPWIPARVNPVSEAKEITAPIVVIADNYSISMSEITALAVQAMPNGHFVGERTWGAMGPLTSNYIYNAGQFATSFMSLVYTSSLQIKALDNRVYEGIGLTPDVSAPVDLVTLATGRDAQLEAAIQLINRQ